MRSPTGPVSSRQTRTISILLRILLMPLAKVEDEYPNCTLFFHFQIIVVIGFFELSPLMTSYDINAQVHRTFDLWENMVASVFMLEFQKDFSIFS